MFPFIASATVFILIVLGPIVFRATYPTPQAPQASFPTSVSADDERFGYRVLAEVLQRSIDRSRFIATLLVALIAAQAGIYVFLVDKAVRLANASPVATLGDAMIIAIIATAPSLWLREAPKAEFFLGAYPENPSSVRWTIMRAFVALTRQNELIGTFQGILLGFSLGLTVYSAVAIHLAKAV